MRALCFEVDDDERIWDFPHQWFLGDDLLVAPVTREGVSRWPVYLPKGEWVDPWRGEAIVGPAVVERDAPIDEVPVYVAAGRAAMLAPHFADLDERRAPSENRSLMEVS